MGLLLNFKLFAIVGLIAAVLGARWYYIDVGYDKAVREIQGQANKEIIQATQKAIEAANADHQKKMNIQQGIFKNQLASAKARVIVEEKIIEVIRNVEVVEIREVDCTRIGIDAMQLLNTAINSANQSR